MYADWNGQIAYTTPNMNGLSLTVGMTTMERNCSGASNSEHFIRSTDQFGFQGQGSYSWTGDFAGKVWAGFFSQEVTGRVLVVNRPCTSYGSRCFNIYL